ncbi:uncharacterized protein PHALS_12710 [Plasmopara halstedii]|uniref:Uncharacterized protein n=1 Tax=Plasmopara halstedii TaxID=4781 RepID=A0A0P1ANX1_PLAHL|nr:uncharacterized protein PHALS_12710 [Plasmopara halstedii]CEG42433.1 hypothetical protein PHALS_12710 [Plasmopara halstedii]|eukprot:XP_024578802.1 hypothetical protein PHALS_12710 [Plasmopara halstedii]
MVAPKNELVGRDRVSAPIEIPTGSPTASSCHGSQLVESRKSHDLQESDDPTQSTMQLFSWEEPSVMLGNGCWPLESDKRICTKGVGLNRNEGRRWVSRLFSNSDDIVENREDADFEGSTIAEDDDDIFKMEVDEGSNSTARRSVFRDNRTTNTKRRGDIRPHRPGILDGLDGNNGVMPLSASFVPPHQMVQRGCFSLGLRDQLKRKPGVQI